MYTLTKTTSEKTCIFPVYKIFKKENTFHYNENLRLLLDTNCANLLVSENLTENITWNMKSVKNRVFDQKHLEMVY